VKASRRRKPARRKKKAVRHVDTESAIRRIFELFHGNDSREERLAYEIKGALFPVHESLADPDADQQVWKRVRLEIGNDDDDQFLRHLSIGLQRRRTELSSRLTDPLFHLCRAYIFLLGVYGGTPPCYQETRKLANRLHAVAIIDQQMPGLPLPQFDANKERLITEKISNFSERNHDRDRKRLGLPFSKAKTGLRGTRNTRKKPN
jgi:hypothetical protein